MRDTFECIADAANGNDNLRHALYDLAAQQIATQAFSLACARYTQIDDKMASELVEQVADYPGVTGQRMRADNRTTVGERATEILMRLARMRPGFAR
jgi:hypothetical protein